MSGDDLLTRATAALRVATSDGHAARTRANVLLAASARRRRRKVIALVWPLAAALLLSTAWAGRHGASARWARVVRAFQGAGDTTRESAATATSKQAPAEATTARDAPGANDEGTAAAAGDAMNAIDARGASDRDVAERHVLPVISAKTRAVNPSFTRAAATATKATSETPIAAAASSASSVAPLDANAASLYVAAHRAHFVDRDPAAALVAWDAYLAAAPDGTLAPEARYNRGVTLVRLGRYDDARRALAPFAADAGGYRAREAKRLLDAIDAH